MKRTQSGQILLITLLVLSVLTTVALALVSRSSTDVNISTQVEESQRAFSAAEAGIEEALRRNLAPGGGSVTINLPSGDKADVFSFDIIGDTADTFVFPTAFEPGEVASYWLVPHVNGQWQLTDSYDGGYLDFCLENTMAAAIISVIYYDGSSYRVSRSALRNFGQSQPDTFTAMVNNDGCTNIFSENIYRQLFSNWGIDVADIPIVVRIRPIINGGRIAVRQEGGTTIQSQGYEYTSCGQAGYKGGVDPAPTGVSTIEQCINVYQLYEAPDSIFDYVLYTDGDLSHN
jgi:type II secretory pathway pseudopilin PulG